MKGTLNDVRSNAERLGLTDYTEFVKGWFDETLPSNRDRVGPIAILRIDCDWYSSVRCCLDNLFDQVVDRGFVIFYDYYAFDGCAVAVHEFLGERKLHFRVESGLGNAAGYGLNQVAVIRKGSTTWSRTARDLHWQNEVDRTTIDLRGLLSPLSKAIWVDEEIIGCDAVPADQVVPFLERDGQFWGPPPDDETAIREVERMRQMGATHIVFAWPAFWWLDYYQDFRQYLEVRYPRVLANERLVAFDLRPSG